MCTTDRHDDMVAVPSGRQAPWRLRHDRAAVMRYGVGPFRCHRRWPVAAADEVGRRRGR